MPTASKGKQLLSLLLAKESGLQWDLARTQEDRLIVLLYALRHAGLEASGSACKIDMIPHRPGAPASAYRSDTGLRALRFSSDRLISVEPGTGLPVRIKQIVSQVPQTHPGFKVGEPYWVETFPMGQPQEELLQELVNDCHPLVNQAVSVADAWRLAQETLYCAPTRSSPRL